MSSNRLNDVSFRPKGSSCSMVVFSVIMLVVSLRGTFVNRDSISKLARVIGWSKFREVTSLTNEVELSMVYLLVVSWEIMGTRNFARLWLKVPMADMMGLRGLPNLCILGRPYKNPGTEPETRRKLYTCSGREALRGRRIRFNLSSNLSRWMAVSVVISLNLDSSVTI